MKERALRTILKYMGMCMVGLLLSAAYTPSAFAGICFIPGNDCRLAPGGDDIDDNRIIPDTETITPSLCRLMVPIENYNCTQCNNGMWKCNGCKVGIEVDGKCVCDTGLVMCNGRCLPSVNTGNEKLNEGTCEYDCKPGYERVTGLTGCFAKCNSASGEAHNASTGRCECPNNGTMCGGRCVSCTTGTLDADTCTCEPGPQCDKPKEYLTLNNNEKTCTGVCHDQRYSLRDRFSDALSDGYSDTLLTDYRCDTLSVAKNFVRDVRDNISGGDCQLCPISGRLTAKNRWRCTVNYNLVENYPDVCYALGYTYRTSEIGNCTSPFDYISESDLSAYDKAVQTLQRELPNKFSKLYNGSVSEECPYAPGYYRLPGQCSEKFLTTRGDAVLQERTGMYTCYECPENIRDIGAGSSMNMYYCEHAPCPAGQEWDEEHQLCDTPQCSSAFKKLDPIDLCHNAPHSCGLDAVSSLITQDAMSDGSTLRCQADPEAMYTASQASILRANGYVCSSSSPCPDLYVCEPAKSLAMAVEENGGNCDECGAKPVLHQCRINDVEIDTPAELCNYLGYTISYNEHEKYFRQDGHAHCQGMSCGVAISEYGRPVAGAYSRLSQYKCTCDDGYILTSTGCLKDTTPYCGYSDGYCGYSAGDGYSYCIPVPPDPNNNCVKAGYTWTGTEREFECGLYTLSSCTRCPYSNDPVLYKCDEPNPECIHSNSCLCCVSPRMLGCGGPGPYPSCDDYSDTDFYSGGGYTDEYLLSCGREKCLTDGYSSPYDPAATGCVKCPYVHSGSTLYNGCTNPESCESRGYVTPYDENGVNICKPCPEDHSLGKNCMHKCVAAGYFSTAPSCQNGRVAQEITIDGGIKCYGNCNCPQGTTPSNTSGCEPIPPTPTCQSLGYQKLSEVNKASELNGLIVCEHCEYDNEYANCRVPRCDDYPITDMSDIGTYTAAGYACEACPDSQRFWRCVAPDCVNKTAVTVTEGCEECTEMWSPSACGCKEKKELGKYCRSGEECPTDKVCGRCPVDCVCTGIASCPAGEICDELNACGNCVEGKCRCQGIKCSSTEKCVDGSGSPLANNACGNCPGQCVNKNCSDYDPSYKDVCAGNEAADEVSPKPRADLTCYTCRAKVCTDYDANYKTDDKSCPTGQKASPVDSSLVGGLTCYRCGDKACKDYNEAYKESCGTNQVATEVSPQPRAGLTCYTCRDKVCTDYDAGYKTDDHSCPTGKVAESVDSAMVDGLTCYSCRDMVCKDYNADYKADDHSCPTGKKAESVNSSTVGGLTCYRCINKTCGDYAVDAGLHYTTFAAERSSLQNCGSNGAAVEVKHSLTGDLICYMCGSYKTCQDFDAPICPCGASREDIKSYDPGQYSGRAIRLEILCPTECNVCDNESAGVEDEYCGDNVTDGYCGSSGGGGLTGCAQWVDLHSCDGACTAHGQPVGAGGQWLCSWNGNFQDCNNANGSCRSCCKCANQYEDNGSNCRGVPK